MNAQNSNTLRARNRGGRKIRVAQPSPEFLSQARLRRHTRVNTRPVEIQMNLAGGRSQIKLDTGPQTYRAIPFMITNDVAIAGETTLTDGLHVVDTAFISKYISNAKLSANGAPMQDLSVDELIQRNAFHGQSFGNGVTGFHFPGPNMYHSVKVRDAFALGTANMRALKLELTQTAAFNPVTMEIRCVPHYVLEARPTGFVTTTERVTESFAAIGKHTFTDLTDADDMENFWLIGSGITDLKVEVDGEVLIDCNRHEYNAMLIADGRDPAAVGDNWFVDFHSDGEPRSLAALDLPAELRRGAAVKIDLTTTAANTAVEFLTTHAGLYKNIR